ncbi:MAG: hypothetical protein AB7J35_21015 [Dehalococcoidia bacterium]
MWRTIRTTLTLLAIIAVAAPGFVPGGAGRALTVQTVEVSEGGFNPGVCRMNREFVQFHNVGSTTIRVGKPGVTPGDPPFDVRTIEPGEYSSKFSIPYGGSTTFIDVDHPEHSMEVITPVFVEYWEPICTPDPDFRPPQPPCRGNEFCLRMPAVAFD